ncbi:MAG: glycosyltransferase family 39 protein [Bacteroidia bacterium]|nr:glycosyltransferase family 39 protein [Bacteroidia bacterium]MDW8417333.1 hypothetical protein [Bacteroidia bacterium]
MRSRGEAIRKYILPFIVALGLKLLFIPLLPSLMKGVGTQIFPYHTAKLHGPKNQPVDTAACPLFPRHPSPIVYYNPDYPSYIQLHIGIAKCLKCCHGCKMNSCFSKVLAENYRLPTYGAIVMTLRAALGEYKAYEGIIILQVLLAALASVFFGDIVSLITQKESLRLPATLIYASFPFIFRYEYILGSEGLYHSVLIFSIWSLYRSHLRSIKMLVMSGLFLTIAYTLRPLTILMFAPFSLYILIASEKEAWKKLAYFLSSFAAFEIIWMPLNWYAHGRPYLILKHHYAPGIDSTEWWRTSELLRSFGDNYYWFYYSRYRLPRRAYTKDFGPQEEKHLVSLYQEYYAEKASQSSVVNYALAWEKSIQKEKPFLYYIGSRFYAALNFLTSHIQEHVTYAPFWQVGGTHAIAYAYSILLWVIFVFGGLILSLYYLVKWKKEPFMAFLSLCAHVGWGSYAGLGLIQSRYILMGLVFFAVLVMIAIGKVLSQRTKLSLSPNSAHTPSNPVG